MNKQNYMEYEYLYVNLEENEPSFPGRDFTKMTGTLQG